MHFAKLGEKPDSLTLRMEYYLKREDRDYMLTDLQKLRAIFAQEKLAIAADSHPPAQSGKLL